MNPKRLLQHFNEIAEAPDAVPRLRRFILDLAVRGKLVEQDLNDEPAVELLQRIGQEKGRLVKEGIRKEKQLPPVPEEDLPFQIPSIWQWSQLAEVGFVNPRNSADDGLQASFVPMPLISADYGIPVRHEVRPWGEIKSGYTHFAEGDVALAKITPCFENGKSTVFRGLTGGIGAGTTELHILRPVIFNPDYALIFLKCPHFIENGIPRMTGTAGQKRVPTEYFAFSPFPLPPLAEQHRIVAKVDELMALCDELEAAQQKRERRRDRLVAATLNALNNGDGGSEPSNRSAFEESARFYFNHLPRLTTRPEHIQQLRQTILNLAVRAKLVPQDPNDEPALELLRLIKLECEQLIRIGTQKSQKPLLPIPHTDLPFQLPIGWSWCRLHDVFLSITDGDHQPPPKAEDGVPFLVIGNIRNRSVDFAGCRFVPESYYASLDSSRRPLKGDILYTLVGSYGIPVLLHDDIPFCIQRHIGILRPSRHVNSDFMTRVLETGFVFGQATVFATGIAQKTVPLSGLRNILIPLPPLAEQHRIVAKVDELMGLCDELESRLSSNMVTRHQLLEAALSEAIAPS